MSTIFSAGDILIPNENAVNGACLINSNTGAFVANPVNLARSGEGGASLANGSFILADHDAISGGSGPFKIFDKTFALLATTASFAYPAQNAMTSDGLAFFYANSSNFPAVVTKINAATGATVFSDTLPSMTLTTVYVMAVNSTNTILYYFDTGSGLSCHRWDLVNHVALPDLFTIPAGGAIWGRDLINVSDTSLALISVRADLTHYDFMRFSTATGALIQTIPLGTDVSTGDVPRLSVDLGAPIQAVWIRTYPNTPITTSVFTQIELTTGTALTTLTVPTGHPGGVVNPSLAPDSCPFFSWSNNIAGGGANVFVGTRQTVPIRRLRRTMQMTNELMWTFFTRFELMFQPGVGNTNDTGSRPIFSLRWSDDGGNTWSNSHELQAGEKGDFAHRAYALALGRGRNRVWEVSTTDPNLWVLVDAFVQSKPGIS